MRKPTATTTLVRASDHTCPYANTWHVASILFCIKHNRITPLLARSHCKAKRVGIANPRTSVRFRDCDGIVRQIELKEQSPASVCNAIEADKVCCFPKACNFQSLGATSSTYWLNNHSLSTLVCFSCVHTYQAYYCRVRWWPRTKIELRLAQRISAQHLARPGLPS